MKDTIKWFGIIAIVAVMGFALVACGDNGDPSSSSGSIPSALVGSWGGDAENPALVINADGSGKISGTSFEKGTFTVADGRITHTMTTGGVEVSGSVKYEITGGKLKLSDPQGTSPIWQGLLPFMPPDGFAKNGNSQPVPDELGNNATYEQALAALDAIITHPDTSAETKKAAQDLKKEITDAGKSNWGSGNADFIDSINDLIAGEFYGGSVIPAITYTIQFNANGGIQHVNGEMEVPAGESIELDGDWGFSRPGYILVGWNTQPDGSGTSYNIGSSTTPGDRFTPTGDITRINLYAMWQELSGAEPPPEG